MGKDGVCRRLPEAKYVLIRKRGDEMPCSVELSRLIVDEARFWSQHIRRAGAGSLDGGLVHFSFYGAASFTPIRPAISCVNCHATRPERDPRVVDHSSRFAH